MPARHENRSENRQRLMEIVEVVRRHEIIKGLTPEKLCAIIEELGPTFIKLGQILSMRSDILPKEYCEALKKLRSSVAPMPYEQVVSIVERSYGRPLGEVFSAFDEQALGSASIAQAHAAVLCSGESVVVKVQRDGIHDVMNRDILLLKRACKMLEYTPASGLVNFNQVLDVDGSVIPGLYAAGECVGGIWGRFVSGGTGVMGPIVFGRLAARAAMATEPATGYTLKTPAAVITEDMFAKDADSAESLFDMSQTLADGEYEATVDGQEGPMTVKVTVADGKIAAVVVAENHETQAVAAAALEKVPQAIVDANSVDVDGVSGATLTSGRIKDAAVKCLTQAAQ